MPFSKSNVADATELEIKKPISQAHVEIFEQSLVSRFDILLSAIFGKQ